ncbi:MarR family transcriptional regulator [Eubacterium sp. MSJ-13]|uniref:MarR family winged helix-turn-helix transcriptional regulator n=1 Tax=Eubacterium sp. MSJ-13 TaxID=2841513 RepID=UPI001C11BCFE|nr:MarR family transcriptional regulator [Eubacterium sp. MSJ-13]MBU5477919.1 MarR family transcriptional regulator [Eubacterium sp. MSJ-13]
MNDKFEELFKAMHQFHKLRLGDMMPNVSGADFWAMRNIVDKGEDGKITVSELAKKTNVLPSAISRTIRGLEDKGYVERTINKNDRRNTYVEMTDKGREVMQIVRENMHDFGEAVLSKLDGNELSQLIAYLNNIYDIAQKEIEIRKVKK